MFGISSALCGFPGVQNISDDIIVYGKDQAKHDRSLG